MEEQLIKAMGSSPLASENLYELRALVVRIRRAMKIETVYYVRNKVLPEIWN